MTGSPTELSLTDLLEMSQSQLDDLYRGIESAGSIPSGDTRGTALFLPGNSLGRFLGAAARPIFWQGKVFNTEGGDLKNKMSPFGAQAIRAKVYRGESWMDGDEATILDYSTTSVVASWIRDEIREIAPGLWLGKVFVRRWHALDFTLTA